MKTQKLRLYKDCSIRKVPLSATFEQAFYCLVGGSTFSMVTCKNGARVSQSVRFYSQDKLMAITQKIDPVKKSGV